MSNTWKWPGVFDSQTGRNLGSSWEAWNEQILLSLADLEPSVTDPEICDAIVWAFAGGRASENEKKNHFQYTSRDIVYWVRMRRSETKRLVEKAKNQSDIMSGLRTAISNATDHEEIWDIVCKAPTTAGCDALREFAKRMYPDFDPAPLRHKAMVPIVARVKVLANNVFRMKHIGQTSEQFIAEGKEKYPEYFGAEKNRKKIG